MNKMNAKDDYVIILSLFRLGIYVLKKRCKECQQQSSKVICLGEEQALLIYLLISDNQQWDIENRKLHITDEEFYVPLRCGERPKGLPILWNQELVQHDNTKTDEENEKAEKEAIKNHIYLQLRGFKYWNKICEPIVIVLAINSCNHVGDRDTLIHLCMNSQYGAVLFRKVIMKTLSLLVANWFDHKKIEEIAEFFGDFLKGLSNYEYQSDLKDNIKARSECICDRIKGSNIDVLYKEMRLRNGELHEKWIKGGDILQYFADKEHRDPIYYVSRLDLIQHILGKKVKRNLWLADSLIQFGGKIEKTNYTKKIREIIDSIDAQDESRQKEAVRMLSKMIDLCVTDWIDEEVKCVHDWFLNK